MICQPHFMSHLVSSSQCTFELGTIIKPLLQNEETEAQRSSVACWKVRALKETGFSGHSRNGNMLPPDLTDYSGTKVTEGRSLYWQREGGQRGSWRKALPFG